MRRHCFLILTVLLLSSSAYSQAEAMVEQYHYVGKGTPYVYMPVAHFTSARNWYTEARYNYEDEKTFSLYFGKTFNNDKRFAYSVTPMVGAAVGKFHGISAGLNVDLEFDRFFFCSQSQYSLATAKGKGREDFYYAWSELAYQPFDWFYAGASFQQTYTAGEKLHEPGALIGFSFGRYSIPVYGFDLLNSERYFIIGFTIGWEGKRKPANNKPTSPIGF